MHNLTKYLCCNKLGGETLHILFIVYTVQAPSGSLVMYLCQKMCIQHSVLHTLLATYMHTNNMHIIVKAVSTGVSSKRTRSSIVWSLGECCFCSEVSIFLTKHHSQRLLAGKVPSKCRELPCMCVCVPACSSQLQQCQVKAEFKCIAAQR